jgi:hypothetical protein
MPPITFVITYLNKDIEFKYDDFEVLAKTGLRICLYVTSNVLPEKLAIIIEKYPNVKKMKTYNLEDTFIYKTCKNLDYSLPDNRNMEKDTESYILMRHSAIELVNDAIQENPWNSNHFSWIDLSQDFMINNICDVGKKLVTISKFHYSNKIFLLPGCWNMLEKNNVDTISNTAYWRFSGTFLLGDIQSLSQFYDIHRTLIETFIKNNKKLIWEFNYWAWLEANTDWKPNKYYGGHDIDTLNIPTQYYALLLNNKLTKTYYNYPKYDNFFPSNTSYLYHDEKHILNTRFVNYSYGTSGGYLINDPKDTIITKNIVSILNNDLIPYGYVEMDESTIGFEHNDSYAVGLEDIRLYSYNGVVKFIATNVNYIGNRANRMIIGEYDIDNNRYVNSKIIQPPIITLCEKNWVPIIKNGEECFIYKWCPFQIGKINTETKRLEIIESYEIPSSEFNRIRGSSIFIDYDEKYLIGVVHFCEETFPRQYYHMLVILDKNTLRPISYSDPFCFQHYGVEFCIGFTMINEDYVFWVSKKDNDTVMVKIDSSEIPIHHKIKN